ncbi:Ubiquitin domain-containing 2 [Schistosoma japonicum]|uniref:Ubiquitin domain-containing 2 n=1 Tax=Schistosoma japonicum TaxID=6182 RepID=A0A4Z2DM85_SCHJA|nr:Ubiquitin domain-containing 2 [Schistosoma japonicum]
MNSQCNQNGIFSSNMQFLANLQFDESVFHEILPVSLEMLKNGFGNFYNTSTKICKEKTKCELRNGYRKIVFPKKLDKRNLGISISNNQVNPKNGNNLNIKASKTAVHKTHSKIKFEDKAQRCNEDSEKFTVKTNENCAKLTTECKSQMNLSDFHFDFLHTPTLLNSKKRFGLYFASTLDKTINNYKLECADFGDLLKFRKGLKEELFSKLFDQMAMKSEIKNVFFHWATECGIEIFKLPSDEIDYIFHHLSSVDIRIQVQTIVSIGIFETELNSKQFEILRSFLLHWNHNIVLATCLCLNILGYSNQTCIEKLNELITIDRNTSILKQQNDKISLTSLNLLKWASSICLCKLDQCNLQILIILTNLLFEQLDQFIPVQYPSKCSDTQMNQFGSLLNKSSYLKDKHIDSFVSCIFNLITFDLKKSNIFLNKIMFYTEIKMIIRLSRNHLQVENYLTELLNSPNWRIRLCSCWLLTVLLCNLSKDTLTRINRLLLLDWKVMLRIAALHSLEAELESKDKSLLWSNHLFIDPLLSSDKNNTFSDGRLHTSSITSKSIPQRRVERLYQLTKEGLSHDDLIRELHLALLDKFNRVREMACFIIEQQKITEEPIIFNELLKIVVNDNDDKVKLMALKALKTTSKDEDNDRKSAEIQNQLCRAVRYESDSCVRREIFHLLLWFIQTRFITCDTKEHLSDDQIDILAKTSIINEYRSLQQKTIDFNRLFNIQNDVIEHVLNNQYDYADMNNNCSNLIRQIFMPNYVEFAHDEVNQIKIRKLQCNLYYIYNLLKKFSKYDQCQQIRDELSEMTDQIFEPILREANKNAPENCFYSYHNDYDLLRLLMNEKCDDIVKICYDVIQYS